MPRTNSKSNHAATTPRRMNTTRTTAEQTSNRHEDVSKIRRYLEFVRAVVGTPTRHGR